MKSYQEHCPGFIKYLFQSQDKEIEVLAMYPGQQLILVLMAQQDKVCGFLKKTLLNQALYTVLCVSMSLSHTHTHTCTCAHTGKKMSKET